MGRWNVVFDLRLARIVSRWPQARQVRLREIADMLAAVGPDAIVYTPAGVAPVPWISLTARRQSTGFAHLRDGGYLVTLDVYPQQTIVIREIEYFE
jgi:hypothetical protein